MSGVWPTTAAEINKDLDDQAYDDRSAPASLTQRDLQLRKWRNVRHTIYNRVRAADFLTQWGHTSEFPSENLTDGAVFPWGNYILGMAAQYDVVGHTDGIIKFYAAYVPGVSDPRTLGDRLPVFIAWRADGSQVRIQPRRDQPALLLYVDPPGPNYFGHLARKTAWPPGCWETPKAECRLCPRAGAERCSLAGPDVIATADGMLDLHDFVTNLEAQSALRSLNLQQGQGVDLSAGDKFAWVLWVYYQPDIMKLIRDSPGVTQFSAVDFSFMREKSLVKAQVFQIDLQHGSSWALIPVGRDVTIAPMTTHTPTGHSECQWLLDHLALEVA